MQEKKLKVAIYCRTATKDNSKIEEQENRLKTACEVFNYEIFEVYKDDGFSGRDSNRPAYKLMLNDLKNKKFNAIITFSIDRITRDISELEEFLKLMHKYNCNFKSIKDTFDLDTPQGKLFARMITIIGTFGVDLDNE